MSCVKSIKYYFLIIIIMIGVFLTPRMLYAQYNAFEDPGAGPSAGSVSGPDLKASATQPIAGGSISIGSAISVVVLFKNAGTAPVTVGSINLYPSSTVKADVGLNQCSKEPVPPGAECAVTIQVTALQTGAWRVELLLDHNGRARLATASITGTVDASGDQTQVIRSDIEAVPAEVDFGSITTGKPLVRSITLRNVTSQELEMKNIRIEAPTQVGLNYVTTCGDKLKPGDACIVSLTWSPTMKGPVSAVLLAEHNGVGSVTQVSVKGDFKPDRTDAATLYPESLPDRGLLISDLSAIDFGTSVQGASAITVSLVNVGDTNLDINSIKLSGSDSGLSIARTGCGNGRMLAPSEACPLTINWLPSRAGQVMDAVQIEHTGSRGILVLPVKGTAQQAVSREAIAVRQDSGGTQSGSGTGGQSIEVTPVLDGYRVTSLSSNRAVISGPVGSQIVRQNEDVSLAGVNWSVSIEGSGVTLKSGRDEMFLGFDRSLKSRMPTTGAGMTNAAPTTTTTTPATTP